MASSRTGRDTPVAACAAERLDRVVVAVFALGVYGSRRGSGKPRLV